ncbi:cytochrome c [Sneathiella sp. CAU 1612]|uniref:Cytochrome c n=1 Tax=Sneathiella sedimenti TaxID=2816034 RepID=A0ABS3F8T3_9PROT|nr:cytochrome c [Sneathiella sedimenti]MBO0334926.1 cytochrome c [Sneathiella sedimenti]
MKRPNSKLYVITLVLALVAVAGYFWLYPGQPEVKTGQPIVVVNVPELSIASQSGKQAFDKYCASCHGSNAAGQEGRAPPLIHRIYEPNHHGDMAFLLAAKNGVRAHHWPFGNMPPVEGISEAEIQNIILYVRELQRANGIN